MVFDREDLLFHEVAGIDINWMEEYGNAPRIMLRGPCEDWRVHDAWFQASIWKRLEHPDGTLWLTTHPNGFVKYCSHSGGSHNGGGFGGSVWRIHLEDGSVKELAGPWSSRATCLNVCLPKEDWIMDTGNTPAIRIDAFLELCKKYNFPYFVVSQQTEEGREPESVHVSTRPDGVFKPSGAGQWDNSRAPFDVLYSPENSHG